MHRMISLPLNYLMRSTFVTSDFHCVALVFIFHIGIVSDCSLRTGVVHYAYYLCTLNVSSNGQTKTVPLSRRLFRPGESLCLQSLKNFSLRTLVEIKNRSNPT